MKELDTKHYDSFNVTIGCKKLDEVNLRVDPYFVSDTWNLGYKDPSGCLFHILKTISRFGSKKGNSAQREIESMRSTLDRLEELVFSKEEVAEDWVTSVLPPSGTFTPASWGVDDRAAVAWTYRGEEKSS